jgi:hypothetical protein
MSDIRPPETSAKRLAGALTVVSSALSIVLSSPTRMALEERLVEQASLHAKVQRRERGSKGLMLQHSDYV